MISMDVDAYLERINYNGSRDVNAETLRALQVAHLLSVPFENLSIHAGEPIVLDEDALFTKIVEQRRGGFCYECNGLFAGLLRALGFDVAMLAAGVAHATGGFGPIFDHMTLMVTLDERAAENFGQLGFCLVVHGFLSKPASSRRLIEMIGGRPEHLVFVEGEV